jgi:hypothetical protein
MLIGANDKKLIGINNKSDQQQKWRYSVVILPWWSKLVELFCQKFVCQFCCKQAKPSNFEKIQIHFASSFNFYSSGCTINSKFEAETTSSFWVQICKMSCGKMRTN